MQSEQGKPQKIDQMARTDVFNLLKGAVPERADELSELWRKYDPVVVVVDSGQGVTLNADDKVIRFGVKTTDLYWLIGFSVWHSVETYSPAVTVAHGETIGEFLRKDQRLPAFERDFKDRLAMAQSILAGEDTDFTKWPSDVPLPQVSREALADDQQRAAFDLVNLALAEAFFHEFRHVMFMRDKNGPSKLPEEEIACDAWARAFLTDKLAAYAKQNGHDYAEVLYKRAAAVALSAFIVHAITPKHAHWGNSQYPPIVDRIEALIGGVKLQDDSRFWVFTAGLLIGIMRRDHRPLDFVPTSPKSTVQELIRRLR